MGASTGIVLGAAGISFANEWLQTGDVNFRIPVAGLAAALFTDGIERISKPAGVGVATIAFVTVMLTPFNGISPVETLGNLANGDPLRKSSTATRTATRTRQTRADAGSTRGAVTHPGAN